MMSIAKYLSFLIFISSSVFGAWDFKFQPEIEEIRDPLKAEVQKTLNKLDQLHGESLKVCLNMGVTETTDVQVKVARSALLDSQIEYRFCSIKKTLHHAGWPQKNSEFLCEALNESRHDFPIEPKNAPTDCLKLYMRLFAESSQKVIDKIASRENISVSEEKK